MTGIRAIETRYAGCHFRSRLEARWAVFFDALGMRWEYESQGYAMKANAYLPDFQLWPRAVTPHDERHAWETFAEVKGCDEMLHDDLSRMCDFIEQSESNIRVVILGAVPYGKDVFFTHTGLSVCRCDSIPATSRVDFLFGRDGGFADAHAIIPAAFAQQEGDAVTTRAHLWRIQHGFDEANLSSLTAEDALRAYGAARSARFEHGQSGAS